MIRLLIADDEEIIRNGLQKVVNWKDIGVEIIGSASDGKEAYVKIQTLHPDVVLTDIKMPYMSGIELIKKANLEGYSPIFVLLSGYADFEYAQQAMRYGVMYYLLKPTSNKELEDVFGEISGKFIKEDDGDENKNIYLIRYKNEIEKSLEYIEQNLDNPSLSLGFVASDVVFMNADYFGRIFKIVTGKYYTQYVMEKRIEKAKQILETTDHKISEIADMVGFKNNVPYFGQVFKKYTGKTPKEYKTQAEL